MAIPAHVGRIIMRGHLYGGDEWETGWWGSGAMFDTDSGCQEVADGVKARLLTSAVEDVLRALWSASTGMDSIWVYGYPAGGPKSGAMATASITTYTGVGSNQLPNQMALVATTETGRPGRSYRGRMFWPATGVSLQNGQVLDGTCANLAQATATLLEPVSGDTGGPVVLSSKLGTTRAISAIRVDSRMDIQRRRAQQESVLYSESVTLTS